MNRERKIAANYIYLPGVPLLKNAYVKITASGMSVVDTGGQIREIAGLEFYGGLIVPEEVAEAVALIEEGEELLPFLDRLFAGENLDCRGLALIEGADLIGFTWKKGARIRLLR